MVVAFVSPSPATNLSGDEVIRVCRERIAGYKTPKRVFVVDALPKNPTGKVERGVLRRMYHELASEAAPASLGPG
jgi:fatty-acyl-CoA synthase